MIHGRQGIACQLQMERSEREMTEQDRDDLQAQCNDLHRQLTEWAQTTDERTYQSHLKNAEGQINGLNDRLHDSLAANVALQSKFDDLHERWESKLQNDARRDTTIISNWVVSRLAT